MKIDSEQAFYFEIFDTTKICQILFESSQNQHCLKNVIDKGSADKSAQFPKLTTVPLYEMKCGIVRYDHLTSFETLAHTFPMFLPSQLSA